MLSKVFSRLIRLLVGAVTAHIAGALFQRAWKLIAGEEETPIHADPRRSVTEVATAGIVQGAIFGLVQALMNRGGAAGIEKVTGERPGPQG